MRIALTGLIFCSLLFYCGWFSHKYMSGEKTTEIHLSKLQVKEFYPMGITNAQVERQWELLEKETLTRQEKKDLDVLIHKYGEVVNSGWEIVNGGCSWY